MSKVEITGYAGKPIRSFSDWEAYAMPPERKLKHWKEGRSAFELGRVWMRNGEPSVPLALVELLESHDATKGTVIRGGTTEHETTLPFGNRGPRCHDLVLKADHSHSIVAICIEAKADETFGGTVREELLRARKRPVTKFPDRLDWLTRSLLGLPAFDDEENTQLSSVISETPYQLLSAIGGTILEAEIQQAAKAVLVVHEFRTALTSDDKMDANACALNRFLRLFLARNHAPDETFHLQRGRLFGPIPIVERPAAGLRRMPTNTLLFIGKIRTDIRTL